MKHFILLAVPLLYASLARADEASDARQVVDRAIAAIGGQERVQRLTGGIWKTNGTVRGNPSKAEFQGQLPDKFRIDSMRLINGEKVPYSRIVNGERGWVVEGSQITPMSEAEISGVRSTFYHKQAATTLLPLLDKGTQLRVAARSIVDGQPVTQIRVTREGFPSLLFTFSEASGMLIKSEMSAPDARTGMDRKVEIFWSDHTEFDGVKMARRSKTFHNGELFIDTEITEFHAASSHPAGTFEPVKK